MNVGPRERFEAFARSVRDILAQRWVCTEKTYETREPQASLLPVNGVSPRGLVSVFASGGNAMRATTVLAA
jgi:hypothetical protein